MKFTDFFVEQVADISDILKIVYDELVNNKETYSIPYGIPLQMLEYGYSEVEKQQSNP